MITNPVLAKLLRVVQRSGWQLNDLSAPTPKLTPIYESRGGVGIKSVISVDEPSVIEPLHGYVITQRGRLIANSLKINGPRRVDPLRHAIPQNGAKRRAMHSVPSAYPVVVSLRHLWEWNYFHFMTDVVGRIYLLDEAGLDAEIPLVIGKYALEVPFVKQVICRGDLGRRNWIIQEADYISADRVIIPHSDGPLWERIAGVADRIAVPADEGLSRRIYLSRSRSGPRHVVNEDELLPVLTKYGFQVIDSANLSMDDQIRLFAETRTIVGVHGAGLTNIAFRKGRSLTVIELRPDNYSTTEFTQISEGLGFKHSVITGPNTGGYHQHSNFSISPSVLETQIQEAVNAEHVSAGKSSST